MTTAKIIKQSISPAGKIITTFECTFPRFILAELNTHRMLSKNTASSRAIPIKKQIDKVRNSPFIPEYIGMNQSGMQAPKELSNYLKERVIDNWKLGSLACCNIAEVLEDIGCHKQLTNRILEPWLYVTAIITATEWDNFFALRCSPMAQPEFAELAYKMLHAYVSIEPNQLNIGDWHLPYFDCYDQDFVDSGHEDVVILVSAGRCARVSYLKHDGTRDPKDDIRLAESLIESGHMSPFEHIAQCIEDPNERYGNLIGWKQYRKTLPNENRKVKDLDALLETKPSWINL